MGKIEQLRKHFVAAKRFNTQERTPKEYMEKLVAVNALSQGLQRAKQEQLEEAASYLKQRAQAGAKPEDILVELFALVREVARREVGMRPYDVQVIGGIGLYEGKIVQMSTGEGKTLAAVSPVALHALYGLGAHVLTFNDYLARRDAEWMGPIYKFLDLEVAFIQEGMGPADRRQAYQADITYLTAKEAGFDFLRDGLVYEADDVTQRSLRAAVVDEADSIFIDEARVPLIIAGSAEGKLGGQQHMRAVVERLQPGFHYAVDEHGRNVYLTEEGSIRAETVLASGDLYAPPNLELLTELNLALHAEALMRRDVDYIVRDGRVEIVDDFTGRVVKDRHWPFGLQTAIEAKEGAYYSEEGQVLGSITLQHFLGSYPFLSGMTATAEPAADELFEFYGLDLLKVPPNQSCIRIDHPDHVYPTKMVKQDALLNEIRVVHNRRRPILVGTTSVVESESLAADLRAISINCEVLNARRDKKEAEIVADAGNLGAVTISTNMAGRGTDIRLGGLAGENYDRVAALGGLYVIGTNRHESRRIDDQLRGRAGRQGDPGSSRFFTSVEDDLLVRYGIADALTNRWQSAAKEEVVNSPILRRQVDRAQRIVEGQNYDIRHTLWRYSDFVDKQRRFMARWRQHVLEGHGNGAVLSTQSEAAFYKLKEVIGDEPAVDIQRRMTLKAVDEWWSQHLAVVTELRDGIHLAEVGGLDPYREFLKLAAESFDRTQEAVDDLVNEYFSSLDFSSNDIGLERMGLRGPSSTWTYLINDQAFADRMAASLVGGRNIGFAAGAATTGPLLMLWALMGRFRRRR